MEGLLWLRARMNHQRVLNMDGSALTAWIDKFYAPD